MSKKFNKKQHKKEVAKEEMHEEKGSQKESGSNRSLYIFSGALLAVVIAGALIFTSFQGTPVNADTPLICELDNSCDAASALSKTIETPPEALAKEAGDIKVELYHFYGTQQCYSCINVGDLAEKTVNTYFKNELESGKIVFGHVNGELAENAELVRKYGATGSSLWIGTYINGEFHKEQNTRVWYKIGNEKDYLEYLKGVLEKKLNGELDYSE